MEENLRSRCGGAEGTRALPEQGSTRRHEPSEGLGPISSDIRRGPLKLAARSVPIDLEFQDCELLGLRPEFGRPEEFLWQYISVPPVCIRPSVAQDGASNEDDLTVKLTEIVFTNALIKQGLVKGAPTAQFMAC